MMVAANDLNVRQMLGELLAGQRALDAKIDSRIDAVTNLSVSHNAEADKRWDRLDAELRTIKHDQRNVEQRTIGLSESIKRIGSTVRPLPEQIAAVDKRVAAVEVVNEQVASLTMRLGTIEQMAWKIGGIAVGVSSMCSIIGAVVLRYGGALWHTIAGKP